MKMSDALERWIVSDRLDRIGSRTLPTAAEHGEFNGAESLVPSKPLSEPEM